MTDQKRPGKYPVGLRGRAVRMVWPGPGVPESRLRESGRAGGGVLVVIGGLLCGGWDVSEGVEGSAVVPPVDPFQGGELDGVEVPPWSSVPDELGLVEADH